MWVGSTCLVVGLVLSQRQQQPRLNAIKLARAWFTEHIQRSIIPTIQSAVALEVHYSFTTKWKAQLKTMVENAAAQPPRCQHSAEAIWRGILRHSLLIKIEYLSCQLWERDFVNCTRPHKAINLLQWSKYGVWASLCIKTTGYQLLSYMSSEQWVACLSRCLYHPPTPCKRCFNKELKPEATYRTADPLPTSPNRHFAHLTKYLQETKMTALLRTTCFHLCFLLKHIASSFSSTRTIIQLSLC